MNRTVRQCLQLLALAACLGNANAAPQPTVQRTPVVRIDTGPIQGIDRNGVQAYLGVPYAAPPVRDLRWMPPEPPSSWRATRQTNRFGNFCPQNADLGVFGQPGGREDCLNLNVYVSGEAGRSGQKLPVFVWIHGGSIWVGAGRDYDATKLALEGKAVVVTINYRLGLLGYFAHPDLRQSGRPSANYGLMDQQFALRWVQRNIEAFGGDPKNVTIAGESSGGNSVLAHVVSPLAAGLFQHAIVMSGASVVLRHPQFGAVRPLASAQELASSFASATGCTTDSLSCMRRLPVDRVLAAQRPYLVNQFIVDGEVIPRHPGEALRSGTFNRVTLINGSTRREGNFFVGFPENETGEAVTAANYEKLLRAFHADLTPQVMQAYPVDEYTTPSEALAATITDMLFACPARAINRWTSSQTPTYAYEFADDTAPSYLNPTTFALGAAHTYELPYLFPGFRGGRGNPVALNPLQAKLSDTMVRYWVQASKAGEREAQWPRYDPAQDNYLSLVLPAPRVTQRRFSVEHKCQFWDATGIY